MSFLKEVQSETKSPAGLDYIKSLIKKAAQKGCRLELPLFHNLKDAPKHLDELGIISWLKHEGFTIENNYCAPMNGSKHNGYNISWKP